jgi:hypothetical protein
MSQNNSIQHIHWSTPLNKKEHKSIYVPPVRGCDLPNQNLPYPLLLLPPVLQHHHLAPRCMAVWEFRHLDPEPTPPIKSLIPSKHEDSLATHRTNPVLDRRSAMDDVMNLSNCTRGSLTSSGELLCSIVRMQNMYANSSCMLSTA